MYRRNASEAWHEIAYTLYPGSTWKHGRFVFDNLQSGEYAIAVWDKAALGTEEHHASESRMQVFPNPTESQVSVSWNGVTDGQIRIIGADGKELKRIGFIHADSVNISTSDLPKGCCTVLRLGKDGSVLSTEKLIIK